MKNVSKILIVLSLAITIYGCQQDNSKSSESEESVNSSEKEFKTVSKIEGTLMSEKTLNAENEVQIRVEDFWAADTEPHLLQSGKINAKNKKISIDLKNPESLLQPITIEQIKKEHEGFITKIECEKEQIKIAFLHSLGLLKSGTNIVGMDATFLCREEVEKTNAKGETELNVPHMIVHMYVSDDFIMHKKAKEQPENLNTDSIPSKWTLNLKKGWNLVRIDQNSSFMEMTSISKIPDGYEWRLLSDLFPERFDPNYGQ